MKITLRGTHFCVTGNFDNHQNTRTVESALSDKGGKITRSIGQKTQVLIAGSGYTRKTETARDRGLCILDEAQLDALLEAGELEVAFEPVSAPAGEVEVDALMGDLRGLLAQRPGVTMWNEVTALLDRCAPEQADVMVDHVTSSTARWSETQQRLCRAPVEWINQMAQGLDAAQHRAVRHLDLDELDFTGTAVAKMLQSAQLTSLGSLNLAVRKKLSATTFKALATHPNTERLRVLWLGFFDQKMIEALDKGSATPHIEELGLYPSEYWRVEESDYRALFGSAALGKARTLAVAARNSCGGMTAARLALLADEALLPAFEHLSFEHIARAQPHRIFLGSDYVMDCISARNFSKRIKHLTLNAPILDWNSRDVPRYDLRYQEQLERLDLNFYSHSGNRTHPEEATRRGDLAPLINLEEMKLPDALRELHTNLPLESEGLARLRDRYPEVALHDSSADHPRLD